MYHALDACFVVVHTALAAFVVSGWAWPRARRLHLLVVLGMWLSWGGLGLIYGFGYCPLTDWHWQVKRARGETSLPSSYVKYYADRVTGADWPPLLVDVLVLCVGLAALGVAVAMALRDVERGRRAESRG